MMLFLMVIGKLKDEVKKAKPPARGKRRRHQTAYSPKAMASSSRLQIPAASAQTISSGSLPTRP